MEELEELIFRSGEQHAIIAQRLNIIFFNLYVSTHQVDHREHCRHAFQLASIHIKPHQSTPIYINHLIHIFTFHLSPVWVSMGWESNRWKEIEAKLLRLPYECPDWFPIDGRFLGRKLGISSLWRCSSCVSLVSVSWRLASPIVSGLVC